MLSMRYVLFHCFIVSTHLLLRQTFGAPHPRPLSSLSQLHQNDIRMDTNVTRLLSRDAPLCYTDMQVYKELMPDPKPARTCVGVAQLPAGGTDVEIEFVAYDG